MKFFLMMLVCVSGAYAMNDHPLEGTTQPVRTEGICLGLSLKDPAINLPLEDYFMAHPHEKKKLALGAGHITDIDSLHPDYQRGGNNELLSDYQDKYDFQQYIDWYTVSAETDKAFKSDMILNLRNLSHQQKLFPKNSWDLIWDASYHPSVFSAPELLLQISQSLKKEGAYITTLPITYENEFYIPGHNVDSSEKGGDFMHKLSHQELKFSTIKELQAYVAENALNYGFQARLYEGPYLLAFREIMQQHQLSWERAIEEFMNFEGSCKRKTLENVVKFAEESEAAKIDPIFRQASLGMSHIIFRKS